MSGSRLSHSVRHDGQNGWSVEYAVDGVTGSRSFGHQKGKEEANKFVSEVGLDIPGPHGDHHVELVRNRIENFDA